MRSALLALSVLLAACPSSSPDGEADVIGASTDAATATDATPGLDAAARWDAALATDAATSGDAATTDASVDAGACTLLPPPATTAFTARFDQLGYLPVGARWAVLLGSGQPAPHYQIVDAKTSCPVGSGTAGPRLLNATSRSGNVLTADRLELASASAPGSYLVVLDDNSRLGPFTVAADSYRAVVPALLEFLAVQRCGATDAVVSKHASCHLFASVASAHSGDAVGVADGFTGKVTSASGPAVDLEGGWHDAGDYIKFVGTTSYMLAVDLLALRDHGAGLGAARDPLKAELRRGLDWLARMLGGATLYHQVSGEKDHDPDWRLPESDTASPIPGYDQRPGFRFASGKGANLLGRSAAAFAFASQVYSDEPTYAATMLAAARQAYSAAASRPGIQNPDPIDFYQEDSDDDDLALGAAALYQATGEDSFKQDALAAARRLAGDPGTFVYWGGVDALALLETARLFADGSPERTELAKKLEALAAPIRATRDTPSGPGAAFGYALPAAGNGSLAESLGAAAACLASRRLDGDDACADVARAQLHWLFGQNPFGLSFMIGLGSKWPQQPHHSLAQAAHLTLTGAIVGGPTDVATINDDGSLALPSKSDPYARWSTDQLLYTDSVDNYICNEPANDFTAALVYVLADLGDP